MKRAYSNFQVGLCLALLLVLSALGLNETKTQDIITLANWSDKFRIRDNRDISGQDIPLPDGKIGIRDIEIDECARQCLEKGEVCAGFAFDHWTRNCYLKSKIIQSLLDARSIVAVRKPIEIPNVSQTTQAKIELLRNVRLRGQLVTRKKVRDFGACKTACEENLRCVAFNFLKSVHSAENCEMYKTSDGREADASADAGFKYQSP